MANDSHSEGWIAFATILLAMAGVANFVFGLGWLFVKEAFPEKSLIYVGAKEFGWAILIFGVLQVIAAFALISRKNWGRIFAIVLAVVSFLAWTTWAGAMPWAGITVFVLDILIIYGLSTTREAFS